MVTATVVATSHVSREAISLVLSRVAIVLVTTIMMSRVVISLCQQGGYQPRQQGGYQSRSQQGGYGNNRGGYGRPQGGGYGNNRGGGYGRPQQGGYGNNRGGYGRPQGGGYRNNRGGARQHTPGYDPNAKYSMKKRIEYKEENMSPTEPLRLNKFLANAGVCSRREADEFIQAGLVTVNGEVTPSWVPRSFVPMR